MAGTFLSYQGFPARRAHFRRSRGYGTDWSYVDIPTQHFKDKSFVLSLPKAGDGPDNFFTQNAAKQGPDDPVVAAVGDVATRAVIEQLPKELDHWGTLTMAEVETNGTVIRLDVNLYVSRLESVIETFTIAEKRDSSGRVTQAAATGTLAMVRVHLVDDRYFWSRGVLDDWCFNVPAKLPRDIAQGFGGLCAYSVKEDGKPYTRAEVAKKVVRSLWGRPTLVKWPKSWETEFTPNNTIFTFDRPPYESAVSALRALCEDGGAEDPILRLDGEVEIREAGDGVIAPAKDRDGVVSGPNDPKNGPATPAETQGVAPWNQTGLDRYRLWKNGEGQSTVREPQYPEDVVMIVGKPLVVSVALDDWEPVLVLAKEDLRFIPDTDPRNEVATVLPLNEDTVRMLTSTGRFERKGLGMDWLRLWVLADEQDRYNGDVDPAVLDLLRRQAWRMYRMPKAAVDRLPGPNAAMLPMLPRAETQGGKRLPITVERFGFAARHKEFTESAIQRQVTEANAALDKLRREIEFRAGAKNTPFVVEKIDRILGNFPGMDYQRKRLIDVGTFLKSAQKAGNFTLKSNRELTAYMTGMMRQARTFRRISDVLTPATALQYENAVRHLNELEALNVSGQPLNEMLSLAKKWEVIEYEADNWLQKAREEKTVIGFVAPLSLADKLERQPDFLGTISTLLAIDKQIQTANEAHRVRRELRTNGAVNPAAFGERVVHRNLPRLIDGNARVVDENLGIIETSGLAGHLANEENSWRPWEGRPFIPRPVRVTFGTTVKPAVAPIQKFEIGPLDLADPSVTGIPSDKKPTSALGPVVDRVGLTLQGEAAQEVVRARIKEIDRILEDLKDPEKARQLLEEQSKILENQNVTQAEQEEDKIKAVADRGIAEIEKAVANPPEGMVADRSLLEIAGGRNVIPKVLDRLKSFDTNFWQAYRVESRNEKTGEITAKLIASSLGLKDELADQDRWNAIVIHRPDLEALISLGHEEPDEINRLTKQCRDMAANIFRRQSFTVGGRHLFARPWAINCDGRVAMVEVRSVDHEGAPCGCETLVVEGSTAFAGRPQLPPITTGGGSGGGYGSSQ